MPHSPVRPYPLKEPLGWLAPAIPLAWLAGEILKDRFLPLNFLFYLPPLGCFFIGAAWTIWNPLRVRGTIRWGILFISTLALLRAAVGDFQFSPAIRDADSNSIRLVHWNASRGRYGMERLRETLTRTRSDLILLSEAPPDLDLLEMVPALFPNGGWYRTDGMALASRFPIEPLERIEMPDGHAWAVRVGSDERSFDLAAVDLRANVFLPRKPDLEALAVWIENRDSGRPLLVAGDFNTPTDSIHFRRFRASLDHAHVTSGGGWPYSWPVPFPLLRIDHIWHCPEVLPLRHRYRFAIGSDHLMQVFDFEFDREPPAD